MQGRNTDGEERILQQGRYICLLTDYDGGGFSGNRGGGCGGGDAKEVL